MGRPLGLLKVTVPQLAPVCRHMREQQLYSKPPPDVLTPHPISEAEPSRLLVFAVLFLFGHNPELMTTDELGIY
ncbi:unnamed protein product [Pleuronectes platessa]|uniref:Uncharacterized protein n=1 Tax=Pleuronectes platessa TaxID=8262 RepID=A0A9N7UPH1_PLEPL|nr:unnamed protein product [Pleuronectes platessa]